MAAVIATLTAVFNHRLLHTFQSQTPSSRVRNVMSMRQDGNMQENKAYITEALAIDLGGNTAVIEMAPATSSTQLVL